MLCQKNGQPELAIDLLQCCNKIGGGDRVQLPGRLVQNEQARLHDHDAGKAEQLLLPARKLVCLFSEPIRNAEIIRHFAHAPPDCVTWHAEIFKPEGKLGIYPVRHDLAVRILHDIADRGSRCFFVRFFRRLSGIQDTPAFLPGGRKLVFDQAQKRCFPAA